jgi:hypothetical protein
MVICSASRFARSSSMPNCCSIELTISSMPNESTTPLSKKSKLSGTSAGVESRAPHRLSIFSDQKIPDLLYRNVVHVGIFRCGRSDLQWKRLLLLA